MHPKDDGHIVHSSSIVAYDINTGQFTTLLDDEKRGMSPYYSYEAKKVVCHSSDGDLYLIDIEIK